MTEYERALINAANKYADARISAVLKAAHAVVRANNAQADDAWEQLKNALAELEFILGVKGPEET